MSEEETEITEKKASFGGKSAGQIIIIILGVGMIFMMLFSFFLGDDEEKNNSRSGAVEIAGSLPDSQVVAQPDDQIAKEWQAALKQQQDKKIKEQGGIGKAVIVNSAGIYDKGESEPIIEIQDKKNRRQVKTANTNRSAQKKQKRDVNPYVAKLSNVYRQWDKPIKDSVGVNLLIPPDLVNESEENLVVSSSATESYDKEYLNLFKEKGIDFLKIYPAHLDLGYNSDYGDLMILTVHHPGLKKAKFKAKVSKGAYGERAAITVTQLVLSDGRVVNVNGVVVDENSRLPSVGGKVNRHIIHNTVFGFGASLLESFGAYKELDSGLVRNMSIFPSVGSDTETTIDTDGLVVANAADAMANSLKQTGTVRPNTLKTKPFKAVGVVFLPNS